MSSTLDFAEVYIDESSQTKHRYLVLGGIITMLDTSSDLSAAIAKARLPELPQGEAKWVKVSKGKFAAYKRIVDMFFDEPNLVHFHALVVDTTQLDHEYFNSGSHEIGFSKEIYQLAIKCSRLYNALFHVYPDERDTTQTPEDLRLILNRGCRKGGDTRDWPFRRCQFRNSKTTPALQLADILTGGLAYRLNGHDKKTGASPAKCDLSAHILERAKIVDPFKDTKRDATFSIWHRRLKKRGVS
jgi:hypothetical protein